MISVSLLEYAARLTDNMHQKIQQNDLHDSASKFCIVLNDINQCVGKLQELTGSLNAAMTSSLRAFSIRMDAKNTAMMGALNKCAFDLRGTLKTVSVTLARLVTSELFVKVVNAVYGAREGDTEEKITKAQYEDRVQEVKDYLSRYEKKKKKQKREREREKPDGSDRKYDKKLCERRYSLE